MFRRQDLQRVALQCIIITYTFQIFNAAASLSNDLFLKFAVSPRLIDKEFTPSHRASSAKTPASVFANLQLQRKDLTQVVTTFQKTLA